MQREQNMLPDELSWKDYWLALMIGVLVRTFLEVWGSHDVYPSVWTDAATAAGIIPPCDPMPGMWRWLIAPLFENLGGETVCRKLVTLGHFSGVLLASLVYLILNELSPAYVRLFMRRMSRGNLLVRGILALGTVFFLCSEPVWRTLQTFSPTTLALLLTLLGIGLAIRFLNTGKMRFAYVAMILFGVLAAESPAGFLYAAAFNIAAQYRSDDSDRRTFKTIINALLNPLVRIVALRRMAACFFLGLAMTVAKNVVWFNAHGGLEAHGWRGVDLVIHYFQCYWLQMTEAAKPIAWLFIFAVCLVPLAFTVYALRRATDDEKFLSYRYGLSFLAVGIISFLQVAGWRTFWFWQWVPGAGGVKSEYLLCVLAGVSALTATWSLCVAAVEVFFRNYQRIVERCFPELKAAKDVAPVSSMEKEINRQWRTAVWTILVLVLLGGVVPYRWKGTERQMQEVIGAYLDEVVAECGNRVKLLFTDGALDAGIELWARKNGSPLQTLSMMSGSSEYECSIRKRGVEDEEDRAMLDSGAADALRIWVNEKTNRLDDVAVQMGVELWKRVGYTLPRCSGVVAFPRGLDDVAAATGRKAAHALAEKILDVYANGRPDACSDNAVSMAFRQVQWWVSRFCHFRSDAFSMAKDVGAGVEEHLLAYELDRQNPFYNKLRRQSDWVAQQKGARLTSREGLRISLVRADFAMARLFAEQILRANPTDPLGNFAVGMAYFMEEQYSRAEVFLQRVLAQRPDDIAVLNNLAVVQLRLDRFDAAQATCDHARTVAARIKDSQARARVESDLQKTSASIARKRKSKQ